MKMITYYRVTFTLQSSLSIGSGIGEYTDKDIAVDTNGTPYIPATTIAGVMRSSMDEKSRKAIFGSIENGANEGRVRIYDAVLCDGNNSYIATRDCVALSEKVAVNGAKFDFQAVEPGVSFVGYIEVHEGKGDKTEDGCIDAEAEIKKTLSKFNSGELRLGSKTTRGYGQVSLTVSERTFEIPKDLDEWLEFNQYKYDGWKAVELDNDSVLQYVTLELINTAGVTIREYTTEYSPDTTLPDYRHKSLHNKDEDGIIPGTSWAGAFRQRFAEFSDKGNADKLFGDVIIKRKAAEKPIETEKLATKSRIVFSESVIRGGKKKQLTRNSIDRFSAATKSGALYTEETYYGGKTTLTMSFPKGISDDEQEILANVILDLHFGYLAIGGLTSVGRGIFEIERVDTNLKIIEEMLRNHIMAKETQ